MESLLGLVGALIGAGAALAGSFTSGRRQSRAEHEKEVRLAAADHIKNLGTASHSIEWLVWKAKYAPHEFSAENIELYDQEIHAALAQIVGSLAVVAALDIESFQKLEALTDELYALDAHAGRLAARHGEDPQGSVDGLSSDLEQVVSFHRGLNRSIADMYAAS